MSGKLWHLQVLRAIAASLVAVDHTWTTILVPTGLLPKWSSPGGYQLGNLGVTTFFVISGFIMIRTAHKRFGSAAAAGEFFLKRLIRIVPMYWLATLIGAALILKGHHAIAPLDVIRSALFIPYAHGPILSQGWTLNYEMFFYALFALALFLPARIGFWLLLGTFLVIVGAGALIHPWSDPASATSPAAFLSRPVILLFAAGMIIARMVKFGAGGGPVRWPLLFASALYAGAVYLSIITAEPHEPPFPLAALFWIPGILAVLLTVSSASKTEGRGDRALEQLGDASYCTYLFGSLTYFLIHPLAVKLPHSIAVAVVLLITSALVANVVGLGFFLVCQRPCDALLDRLLRARPARVVDASA